MRLLRIDTNHGKPNEDDGFIHTVYEMNENGRRIVAQNTFTIVLNQPQWIKAYTSNPNGFVEELSNGSENNDSNNSSSNSGDVGIEWED